MSKQPKYFVAPGQGGLGFAVIYDAVDKRNGIGNYYAPATNKMFDTEDDAQAFADDLNAKTDQ